MSDEVPPENPPEQKFEGAEVPREPSGRVSRKFLDSNPEEIGERMGTPEQITALTIRLAEMQALGWNRKKAGLSKWDAYRKLNTERSRLMRRRDRMTRDRTKLRLVKAQSAEKIARRTVEEAAKAVEGTAAVLRGVLSDFGIAASTALLPSLVKDLAGDNADHRLEVQRIMRDITVAIVELQKTAYRIEQAADKRNGPVATGWPDEGQKT